MDITAERIKNRRIALGLSQDELAQKCGYKSRSSINKIENNAGKVPMRKIQILAKALNTSPDYLMGWSDDESAAYDYVYLGSNKEMNEALNKGIDIEIKKRLSAASTSSIIYAYLVSFGYIKDVGLSEEDDRFIDAQLSAIVSWFNNKNNLSLEES